MLLNILEGWMWEGTQRTKESTLKRIDNEEQAQYRAVLAEVKSLGTDYGDSS